MKFRVLSIDVFLDSDGRMCVQRYYASQVLPREILLQFCDYLDKEIHSLLDVTCLPMREAMDNLEELVSQHVVGNLHRHKYHMLSSDFQEVLTAAVNDAAPAQCGSVGLVHILAVQDAPPDLLSFIASVPVPLEDLRDYLQEAENAGIISEET